MITLYVLVEGDTELSFIKHTVGPHLASRNVFAIPIEVTTKRERDGRKHRGGGDWTKWKADIERVCRDGRANVRVTTLFDLYGLPGNFPGRATHAAVADTRRRVELLEAAMAADIGDPRFIPYLQRHEFEALVLAALSELASLLESPNDLEGLRRLQADIGDFGPEDVNDGEHTAPSKWLASFIPSYNPPMRKGEGKSLYGPLVTEAFGLTRLREKPPVSG